MPGDGWLLEMGSQGACLALLLCGYVLADFVFQPDKVPNNKVRIGWLALHVLIVLATLLAVSVPFISLKLSIIVLGIAVLHGGLDRLKVALTKKWDERLGFIMGDQALHIIVTAGGWWLWTIWTDGTMSFLDEDPWAGVLTTAAVVVGAYAFSLRGGAVVVASVLGRFTQTDDAAKDEDKDKADDKEGEGGITEAQQAMGRTIGALERVILLTLVLLGQWGALGLVLAAKSVARFKDLEKRNFAEYYLVGTLTSVLVAMTLGLIVKWLL